MAAAAVLPVAEEEDLEDLRIAEERTLDSAKDASRMYTLEEVTKRLRLAD